MRHPGRRVGASGCAALTALVCGCAAPPPAPADAFEPKTPPALYEKPGFAVEEIEGQLWVRKPGQPPPQDYVTLIGVGPGGCTVKASDRRTALEYLTAKPGFAVELDGGRVRVRRASAQEPEPEEYVTLPGAGPCGMSVEAADRDTALAYVATVPGFEVEVEDGRAWVFEREKPRAKAADHAMRSGVGPQQMTVRAADAATIDRYLAVCAQIIR